MGVLSLHRALLLRAAVAARVDAVGIVVTIGVDVVVAHDVDVVDGAAAVVAVDDVVGVVDGDVAAAGVVGCGSVSAQWREVPVHFFKFTGSNGKDAFAGV